MQKLIENKIPAIMTTELRGGAQVTNARWPMRLNFVQVFLVLCQGYLPEKRRANRTQNSHLKFFSWGLGT